MATSEQRRNASIIIAVGRSLGASHRDIVIALMVALQESSLRNLNYGHLDSVGLFQQRRGWGTLSQRMNPTISARMFFTGGLAGPGTPGLLDIRHRGRLSLTRAAQAVQRSAAPNAYARHYRSAAALMGVGPAKLGGRQGVVTGGGGGGFLRPVRGGRISQAFGVRNRRYVAGYNTGLDIAVPYGSPVYAASSGTVVRVASGGAYGNRVEIAHGGKIWTVYAHLSKFAVVQGQQVQRGQVIGAVGTTGHSTGPHLDFTVRRGANRYRNAVDPMPFLSGTATPSAYLDVGTEVVPGDVEQQQADMLAGLAQDSEFSKPHIYINPLDFMTEPQAPIYGEDPMASYGSPKPIGEPTMTGGGEPLEPEPVLAGPRQPQQNVNRGLM